MERTTNQPTNTFIVRTIEEDKEHGLRIATFAIEQYREKLKNEVPEDSLDIPYRPSQIIKWFPCYSYDQVARWIREGKVGQFDTEGKPTVTRNQLQEYRFRKEKNK